jgi:bifunctional UDP-N-acetylglucosamine pyrophosphorylase/glucosamine-1-phosphate N-acetyltransferase/UDP-N-acetylglucosamine pyrophosphorylase
LTTQKVAVVMAAGKGTRMNSELPKVLVPVCGRPMIDYVLDALAAAGVDRTIVVVGYRADDVRSALASREHLQFALQEQQLGTGHAVMMCRPLLAEHRGPVLIVAGDSPLMQPASLRALLDDFERRPAACILGTGYKDNPTGLGRVVRDTQRNFLAIVEEKDATAAQKSIREVNLSCYVFDCQALLLALEQIRSDNSQREYYLTDCPGVLKSEGKEVRALDVLQPCETLSINTMQELEAVEATMKTLHQEH